MWIVPLVLCYYELTGLEKKFSTSLEKQRQQLSTERLSWIKSQKKEQLYNRTGT